MVEHKFVQPHPYQSQTKNESI